ncbi:MAG: hypothetical protein Kow0022_02470 [Phycisphaerales bacterium]
MSRSGRFVDNLVDAPLEYLRLLRTGLFMLSASILLGFAAGLASLWHGGRLLPLVGIVCAPLWLAGAWLTTSPRPTDPETIPDPALDDAALRRLIRAAQSVVLLGSGLLFAGRLVAWFGGAGTAFLVPWLYGCGVGMLLLSVPALIPFGIYLAALSDWAGHGPVSMQFRFASITIALCGSIGLILCIPVIRDPAGSGVTALVAVWSGVLTILGTGYFLVLVVRLANTARWAVCNALEAMARDARLAERRERQAEAMASRMQRPSVAPQRHLETWESDAPIPLAEEPHQTGQGPSHS